MRPSSRATLSPAHTCAPEPKARCRLGSRATSRRSGSGNSAGSRLAAPMPIVMKVPAGMSMPPSVTGSCRGAVAELVGALEAQQLLDRAADQPRLGDQARLLLGPFEQRVEAVADQVGRGLVAGVEDEDDVVQQLALGEARAFGLALDQAGQHVALGIAGTRAAVGDEAAQVGEEVGDRLLAARALLGRQHRLERTQDRKRPVAQGDALLARHGEQVADHLHRHGGGEVGDQIGAPPWRPWHRAGRRPGPITGASMSAMARGVKRAGDDAAHARVQRRVVEDQAGGVVLEEQAVAVLGRELALLVGGVGVRVLVDGRRSRHSGRGNSRRRGGDARGRARAARDRWGRGWRR